MALYAIGDLHLSLGSDKPMEIFGDGWKDYVARIREGFSVLTEDDVTVLCGDLSWGMSLVESLEDFRFIDALPGKKYLLKGNHDYWWNTAAKMERFFAENGLTTMEIVDELETLLGIPVITSHQATLWSTLRHCRVGAKLPKLGKLFTL